MDIKAQIARLKINWWTVLVFAFLIIALMGAGLWDYLQSKLDKINYVETEDNTQEWTNEKGEAISGIASLEHFNILLLGTDERAPGGNTENFETGLQKGARADACMLLSVNLKDYSAKLVSLERAIGVTYEGHEDWLTHVFAYGGAQGMLEVVREHFGVDVRRYARVNVSSAAQLIDAIGGVDITLTATEAAALNGQIYTNSTTRHPVKEGLNHLDGFDALAYGRLRAIDSDFNRVQRQRNVLQAAINQTKNLSLRDLDKLLNVALPLVETNMTKQEINSLMPKAVGFLGVQLKQMTLPLKGTYGSKLTNDGRSMMMIDQEETAKILDGFFYGSFDPATYQVPAEVSSRVWQAQQAAAIQWAANHPEAFETPKEEEPQETEGNEDNKENTTSSKKKKAKKKKAKDDEDSSSKKDTDEDE